MRALLQHGYSKTKKVALFCQHYVTCIDVSGWHCEGHWMCNRHDMDYLEPMVVLKETSFILNPILIFVSPIIFEHSPY